MALAKYKRTSAKNQAPACFPSVFALFDLWTKLTDAGKAEALAQLQGMARAKAASGVAQ